MSDNYDNTPPEVLEEQERAREASRRYAEESSARVPMQKAIVLVVSGFCVYISICDVHLLLFLISAAVFLYTLMSPIK